MGWEDHILPRLAKAIATFQGEPLIDLPPPFNFGIDRKATRDLSPNHHEMGVSYDLLHAAFIGNQLEWQSACDTYQHLLNLHLREIGLWTSEQFTGAPHGGFYLSSLVAARMSLIIARNRSLIPIPHQLIADLDEYTYRTIQYLAVAATPTGEVICCGERMPKGPHAGQQSAFYRELIGIAHPPDEARKIKRQIDKPDDYYWLSLRGLRKLIEAGDHIRSIADQVDRSALPFTSQQVTIVRYEFGHSAWYSAGRGDGTCEWVDVRGDRVSWGPRGSVRPGPASDLGSQTIKTQKRGDIITMPPIKPKAPETFEDLDAASRLPWKQAKSIIGSASNTLVEAWGRKLYGANFGHGYMHSTDHYAALEILLDREPTYKEVYDSYHIGGSKNIDAARVKSGGGLRPSEWDSWTETNRLYAVLVHRYGITRGSRILDGKVKDTDPIATQKQLDEWNGVVSKPIVTTDPAKPIDTKPIDPDPKDPDPKPVDPVLPPPPPPPPIDPVKPKPTGLITGSITLSIDGVTRRFTIREEK